MKWTILLTQSLFTQKIAFIASQVIEIASKLTQLTT